MRSFTRPRAHIWLLAGALLLVSRPFSSPGGDHSQNTPRAAHIHRLSRVHGFNIRRGAFQVITRGSETCDRGSPMESDLQEPSRPVESCRFSAGDRSDLACPRGAVLPILSRRGSAGDIRQLPADCARDDRLLEPGGRRVGPIRVVRRRSSRDVRVAEGEGEGSSKRV